MPYPSARRAARLSFLALTLVVLASAQAVDHVVISQVYGGGGNSGATYTHDFVELFNPTAAPVSLAGWSVQYASSTGSTWQVTPLSGVIEPGKYYLVQQAKGSGGTTALPAPDASGTIPMSSSSGKVALEDSTVALAGTNPSGLIDLVGFGSAANGFETAPTPNLSNTTAALRKNGGATDTNNNAADFTIGAPAPRNSGSVPPPSAVEATISQIQGTGAASPFDGKQVISSGVVTATKYNGFYMQAVPGDGNPASSDGILVFTNGRPPAIAVPGNILRVTGTVDEYFGMTEIVSPTVELLSSGAAVPSPTVLTSTDPSALEALEGMLVRAESLTVVAPTDGTVDERNANGRTNGVFYGVLAGVPRPFREPGLEPGQPLPPGAPATVPRFDGNPERLRVDSDAATNVPLEVTSGAVVTGVQGPLDFSFDSYTIIPSEVPAVIGSIAAVPAPAGSAREVTVASFNLQRFYDTTDDAATSDVLLTAAAFDKRLAKASLAIRSVLNLPDVLGVQEVENLAALQALAARLNADVVAGGGANPEYVGYLEEGNDIGGIDVGFLVKTAVVDVKSVVQYGKTTTFPHPDTGNPAVLNDRPPLVLEATASAPGSDLALSFTVIVNHLRSLNDVETSAFARAKRQGQAEYLANLVQARQTANPTERIVVIGDMNAFQVNDGYVDVIGTVLGTPAPADQVVLASPDLVNPDLVNLVNTLPEDQRYSYVHEGNAQILDHAMVNQAMLDRLNRFTYARLNADFPESYRSDAARPERLSDHDVPVGYFNLPFNRKPVANAGPAQVVAAFAPECRVPVTLDGSGSSDPDGDSLTYGWTGAFGTATGVAPLVQLGVGLFPIQLTVTDSVGLTGSAATQVRVTGVNPASVVASPNTLWPVNGKMVNVRVAVNGLCDANARCAITGVSSNEEIGAEDWALPGDLTVRLKARRSGQAKEGRIYTIALQCTDAAGFSAVREVAVLVPHDQRAQ